MRTKMAISLLENCHLNKAKLHAFVVMTHHVHVLVKPNDQQTVSQLVSKIKRQSALSLGPELNHFEQKQLNAQMGLNDRRFWKVGFRGLPIHTESIRLQKVNYIHQNPVRANKVGEANEYLWSSSHIYKQGFFEEFAGVDFEKSIEFFRNLS